MSLLLVQPIPSSIASSDAMRLTSSLAIRGAAPLIPDIDSEIRFTESATVRPRGVLASQNRLIVGSQSSVCATAGIAASSNLAFNKAATIGGHGSVASSNRMTWTPSLSVKAKAAVSAVSIVTTHSVLSVSATASVGSVDIVRITAAASVGANGYLVQGPSVIATPSQLAAKASAGIASSHVVALTTMLSVQATASVRTINLFAMDQADALHAIASVAGTGSIAFPGYALNDRGFNVASRSFMHFYASAAPAANARISSTAAIAIPATATSNGAGSLASVDSFGFPYAVQANGRGHLSCQVGLSLGSSADVSATASIGSSNQLISSSMGTLAYAGFISSLSSMSFPNITDPDGMVGLGPHMNSHSANFICKLRNSHRLRAAGSIR